MARHCDDPAIKRWRFIEGSGRVRLYAWYEEGDYIVVLEESLMGQGRVYRKSLRVKYGKREL